MGHGFSGLTRRSTATRKSHHKDTKTRRSAQAKNVLDLRVFVVKIRGLVPGTALVIPPSRLRIVDCGLWISDCDRMISFLLANPQYEIRNP